MVQRDPERIRFDRLTGRPIDSERHRIDPGLVRFCRGAHAGRAGDLEMGIMIFIRHCEEGVLPDVAIFLIARDCFAFGSQ